MEERRVDRFYARNLFIFFRNCIFRSCTLIIVVIKIKVSSNYNHYVADKWDDKF